MKSIYLFLKEHLSFILFQVFLVLFILLLYWLDGFRNLNTAIYSILLSSLLTAGFLCSKYILRRSFYTAITRTPERMEDALIRFDQTPEHRETAAFMRMLY